MDSALDCTPLDWLGDGFLAVDAGRSVTWCNKAALALLGRPREQVIGRELWELLGEVDRPLIEAMLGRAERIVLPLHLSELARPFEVTIYPCAMGTGLLLRDVSETIGHELRIAELNATLRASQELLRHKNDELNQSLEELERLNRRLEEMDQIKSEFLTNTSHELRTPLNSIIGFLQLILEGLCESREEELTYVDNALSSARHLLALITDILDIARIEAGRMTLVIDDIEIDELLHDVAAVMEVQAQAKGLRLEIERDPAAPPRVRADAQKLRQVLINLVANAIKFTRCGSVRLFSGSAAEHPDTIRFEVSDTGIGIPAEYLDRVFDKFMQVDPSSTRRFQGTGLGLTIARNLVEMMGGSIRAMSEGEGRGSTIRFTLPAGSGCEPNWPAGGKDLNEVLPTTF